MDHLALLQQMDEFMREQLEQQEDEITMISSQEDLRELINRPYDSTKDIKHLEVYGIDVSGLDFMMMPNLQSISFFLCDCVTFGDFPRLKHLEDLFIDDCTGTEGLESIGHISSLRSLGLRGYFGPNSLPRSIRNLSLLTSLDLCGNSLTSIPSYIKKMEYLTCLILTGNSISVIPSWIMCMKNLESLELECNAIREIPSEIFELQSLKFLNLSSNKINHVPHFMGSMSNLDEFLICGNPVTLPTSVTGVKIHGQESIFSMCKFRKLIFLSSHISIPLVYDSCNDMMLHNVDKKCITGCYPRSAPPSAISNIESRL